MKNSTYIGLFILSITVLVAAGCQKFLPQDRESISGEALFVATSFEPVLGRTTLYTKIFSNPNQGTSYPVEFKIVNMRKFNGDPAPELTDIFPVQVWKQAYTGEEKTLQEIEEKRVFENRPLFEVRKHSGDVVLWAEARSAFIAAQPDSGYVFDIELQNTGGRRYFRNMRLKPYRERAFEPTTINAVTGQSVNNRLSPSIVSGITGAKTNERIGGGDVHVFIRRAATPTTGGNTLKFIFLDTLFKPMNPQLFDETQWDNLVHGFNKTFTDTSVVYNMAYPIPATELPTRYTTVDGTRAVVEFKFSRLAFGGLRQEGIIGLNFAIYEKGDWEIVFAFVRDNPKFEDDN